MNSVEYIIESLREQNDMTNPVKLDRIELAEVRATDTYKKLRDKWDPAAARADVDYSLDYTPVVKVEDIESLTNEDWLESRKSGIGGSEAGAILGLNKYENQTTIAMNKLAVKPQPEKDAESQYTLDFGHMLEALMLRLYEAKSGNVTYTDRHQYNHPHFPYMLADCDGFAITPEGEPILLELKSYNYNLKDQWKSGIYGEGGIVKNAEYIAQVRHYLSVLNLDRADIIANCGNMAGDMTVVTVYRDFDFEVKMISEEGSFWQMIENYEVPSSPNGTLKKEMFDKIKALLISEADEPRDPEKPVEFTSDLLESFNEVLMIDEQKAEMNKKLKKLDERRNELLVPVLEQLGKSQNGEIDTGNGTVISVSYKPTIREGVDKDALMLQYPEIYAKIKTEIESARILRIKEKKKKFKRGN